MKRFVKGPWLWIVVAVVGVLLALQFLAPSSGGDEIPASEMAAYIESGEVEELTFVDGDQEIRATLDDGVREEGAEVFSYWVQGTQPRLYNAASMQVSNGEIEELKTEISRPSALSSFLFSFLPLIIIFIVFLWLLNNMQGGGGRGVMQFGKSKAKLISKDMPTSTFADVAGANEAIEELGEIKEFLQEPAKFQAVGAKIPKGVLLYGPPGTGKTLLARAVAGEAGVPFYSISGSDFVEMFVGVGASRVRDLFEQAKENAPAIVFIDEIDAVGRHRGAGMGGGHDEREQTLNQLLVEMDGFEANEGVIIIAATNRKDVLDPALLRPGRFDRQVSVGNPDIKGREKILGVHARKTPLGPDVDLRIIARGTPGFSGADLANLVNEAALTAARVGRRFVAMMDFESAKDKIMMGAERRSMVLTQDQKEKTAYHEAGHAIVGIKLPKCDPVYKATIIPRGGALGMVMSLPEMDKLQMFKDEAEQKIAMTMAGKAAEIFKYGAETVSSGPRGDIMQASQLARGMVMRMGMSDKVGNIDYSEAAAGYQANGGAGGFSVSAATKELIESEVKRFIDEGYDRAYKILSENEEEFERLAQGLLEYETLTGEEIKRVIAGKPPQDPDGDDTSGMDKPSVTAIPKAKGKKTPPSSGLEPEPMA